SAWARGPRTAGPLERLSIRNWMPPRSIARAMMPSSASISRTRWPLAKPPMAGLQDISPILAGSWVTSSVVAPIRAEAAAASVPAWPPPTTTTSNPAWLIVSRETSQIVLVQSLTDAELAKDDVQDILDIDPPGDPPECP